MKQKIIFIISILVLILVGLVSYLIYNNNKIVNTITIDVNPSIELGLKKDKKIVSVKSLNKEGVLLTKGNLKGKTLSDAFDVISKNIIKNGFDTNGEVVIIFGMKKKDESVVDALNKTFEKQNIKVSVIIPDITENDIKEAKKYGITPAKAAYIKEVIKDNKKLEFNELLNKPASELKEMKETGKYCDNGYTLNGDFCKKKTKEASVKKGITCPNGYEMVDNKCYKTDMIQDEEYCNNGQVLNNHKCTGEYSYDAERKCTSGKYNESSGLCEELIYSSEGTKSCSGDNPKISQKGTCTYPKPMINGGCVGGDVVIGGWCYNMVDGGDQYPKLNCPSGTVAAVGSKGEACYVQKTYTPTYYCASAQKLSGTKCIASNSTTPNKKHFCASGYTLYEDRMCVNFSDVVNTTAGYVCDKDYRLENNKCIYYEVVEAKVR